MDPSSTSMGVDVERSQHKAIPVENRSGTLRGGGGIPAVAKVASSHFALVEAGCKSRKTLGHFPGEGHAFGVIRDENAAGARKKAAHRKIL